MPFHVGAARKIPYNKNLSDLESEQDEFDSEPEQDEFNYESEHDEYNSGSEHDKFNSGSEQDEFDSESEEYKPKPKVVKPRSDQDLRTKIWFTLKELETPSAFAFGTVPLSLPIPGLCLPRHGVLGLPLSTKEAKKIISEASQSPFGKGEKTVIDTTVRKCWELNPNQFSLKNPDWDKAMKAILDTVCTGLCIKNGIGKVSAQLNKLLLYEPGAFFKPHKDSEKAPGMFATLVVCLPSAHEGGKLIMTFDNEKYEFETAISSSFSFSYAAWYADITHEILPVKSGYRLMLTYNLIRQTDFVIPSYDLGRGGGQQLLTLLEQYKSQLEAGDRKLPPILVHKLKHKYTQTSLKLESLKPQDLVQVQALTSATKLGFDIYLATLELEVRTDEECTDYEEKECNLQNMVELNGKFVVKSYDYPDGALIDPMPQDSRKADKKEADGPTGNEGCPVTQWYHDAVIILVPPAKQLDFVFGLSSSGKVIEPLFCKLMQEFSENSSKKQKLEQLCERALKQKEKPKEHDWWDSYCRVPGQLVRDNRNQPSKPNSYFEQAAATALDLGRIDLFDEACKTRGDKIIFDNARILGRFAAKNGITTISKRLMKGLQIASSFAKKIDFIKSVAEGFEAASEKPGSAEQKSFKQWSDKAVLTAVTELKTLSKDDALSFAQQCRTMDQSLFKSNAMPVILKAGILVKITFINGLVSTSQKELAEEQRSFIETIIHDFWKEFAFNYIQKSMDNLNENDIHLIIETTLIVISANCVESTIIPAMLSAIPSASKKYVKELFIPLVRLIIKNELAGFKLPTNDAVPPLSHKCLVQALLIKFVMDNTIREPETPTTWSLAIGSCNCPDCSLVNKFLQDPSEVTFDVPCSKTRRLHLYQSFTSSSKDSNYTGLTYDVITVRGSNPNIWRITKHQRGHEVAKSESMKSIKSIAQILSKLKKDELVSGRLKAYLQPYYSIIMKASIQELPDLKSLVITPQSSKTNKNVATSHSHPTGHKREVSKMDLLEDRLTKRAKQEMDS